ncbi:putative F-box domain, FBD domain, leucine-rich repeat domain superfamily [Helianthus annuus]|nr:putative F-box domain, FBD domain, leucine-rich repeat domain superfamily [Helianthus annuus]KAJ0633899.1 putative F-box domain, FBD domain, leucine-rich repeat domain superfamily [Helianthus annuus]
MSSISENVVDRLSRLPEEILSHILSLMPMKFAVQTSILSKRWRYIWMFVTNLDFGDIHSMDSLHSLTKIVDRVVSNWIDELVRLKISELDLQVQQLQLPPSMFTCRTLTKLRLDRSGYAFRDVWEFKCPVNLPCLKTLDIAVYATPSVNAFKLISGCPKLENLSLEVTWFNMNEEEDYVFNIPTLKRLKLTWSKYDLRINKVILNVPNLEHLYVCGALRSVFVMEDVSSLVEASVPLDYVSYGHLSAELLKGLSGVKSLSVYNQSSPCDVNSPLPIFPSMTHLVLKRFRHFGQIFQFLESSPELKQMCVTLAEPFQQKPEEYSWVEPELVPACMLTNLTTIKYSICEWWKRDIPFLKYMMGNAKVLKTITITWENMSNENEKLVCAEAVKLLRRASRYCEIHFHEN